MKKRSTLAVLRLLKAGCAICIDIELLISTDLWKGSTGGLLACAH